MTTHPIQDSARSLMAQARDDTGIDIIDTAMEEPLARLLASMNAESTFSAAGAIAMRERLLRLLRNRLRMERDFLRHPEITEQVVARPLILTGAPRTGSTKLHKLLAATGDFNFIPFWQSHMPSLLSGDRDEDPQPRIQEAQDYIAWVDANAPQARLTHPYDTFEPEEENLLLEHCLFMPLIVIFANIPSYLAWYATQDFREQLRYLKRALQYLQWQFHRGDTRPWVLKSPGYPGYEADIMAVFPDARLVCTHRHPAATMSSIASLVATHLALYNDAVDKHAVGAMMLPGQAYGSQRYVAVREAHPDLPILDIAYADLVEDGAAVMARVYAHADRAFTASTRESIAKWEADNAQHKHGVHRHSLGEFGLSREAVEAAYAPYLARYGELLR